jgi:hypothetical protein
LLDILLGLVAGALALAVVTVFRRAKSVIKVR